MLRGVGITNAKTFLVGFVEVFAMAASDDAPFSRKMREIFTRERTTLPKLTAIVRYVRNELLNGWIVKLVCFEKVLPHLIYWSGGMFSPHWYWYPPGGL